MCLYALSQSILERRAPIPPHLIDCIQSCVEVISVLNLSLSIPLLTDKGTPMLSFTPLVWGWERSRMSRIQPLGFVRVVRGLTLKSEKGSSSLDRGPTQMPMFIQHWISSWISQPWSLTEGSFVPNVSLVE